MILPQEAVRNQKEKEQRKKGINRQRWPAVLIFPETFQISGILQEGWGKAFYNTVHDKDKTDCLGS